MTSGAAASRPVFYPNSLVIVDLGSIFELGLSWTYHKRSPWGFSLEASGPLATASSFGRMIILATSPYLELLGKSLLSRSIALPGGFVKLRHQPSYGCRWSAAYSAIVLRPDEGPWHSPEQASCPVVQVCGSLQVSISDAHYAGCALSQEPVRQRNPVPGMAVVHIQECVSVLRRSLRGASFATKHRPEPAGGQSRVHGGIALRQARPEPLRTMLRKEGYQ